MPITLLELIFADFLLCKADDLTVHSIQYSYLPKMKRISLGRPMICSLNIPSSLYAVYAYHGYFQSHLLRLSALKVCGVALRYFSMPPYHHTSSLRGILIYLCPIGNRHHRILKLEYEYMSLPNSVPLTGLVEHLERFSLLSPTHIQVFLGHRCNDTQFYE